MPRDDQKMLNFLFPITSRTSQLVVRAVTMGKRVRWPWAVREMILNESESGTPSNNIPTKNARRLLQLQNEGQHGM